jgi:hypothetical protein
MEELIILCKYKLLEKILERQATNEDLTFYENNIGIDLIINDNEYTLKCENYIIIIDKSNISVLRFNKEIREYEEIEYYTNKLQLFL